MKVKVLRKWRDVKTGEVHKAGEIVEITKKRFNEVCKVAAEKGFDIVEEYVEKEPVEAPDEQPAEQTDEQPEEADE